MRENFDGAGAANASKIEFKWHARNYEDIILALNNKSVPSISGAEARREVALISAILVSTIWWKQSRGYLSCVFNRVCR